MIKFLLAYRTTPHTGVTPAFIMFGRELRTKLPELRNDKRVQDECVRDCDWNHKLAGKRYADNRRCGKPITLLPGDRLLLTNSRATGTLATNFEQKGVAYRRSSSFVKPYTPPEEPQQPEATGEVAVTGTERMCANTPAIPRSVSAPPRVRPDRETKVRYKAYVVK